MVVSKSTFLFGRPILGGYVNIREGKPVNYFISILCPITTKSLRRERIGWMPETRFAHVKERGRSLTPTKGYEGSWRGPEHLPVDCVIRRRRRKGPKETEELRMLKDVTRVLLFKLYKCSFCG